MLTDFQVRTLIDFIEKNAQRTTSFCLAVTDDRGQVKLKLQANAMDLCYMERVIHETTRQMMNDNKQILMTTDQTTLTPVPSA